MLMLPTAFVPAFADSAISVCVCWEEGGISELQGEDFWSLMVAVQLEGEGF